MSINTNLNIEVGDLLRQARETKGWSQSQLAKKMGSNQPTISRIENGNGLPTLQLMKKIADAFEVKLTPPQFEFTDDE